MRILSRYFRGKFLALVARARAAGRLRFGGSTEPLADDSNFGAWIAALMKKEWVVYAKRPFGSPERVLKYLARYTHRVAISNSRIVSVADGRVAFRFRDAKRGNTVRVTSMAASEFLRRFLVHVVPAGFVRIRHFGIFGNRCRKANLARCRELLGIPSAALESTDLTPEFEADGDDSKRTRKCASCGSTHLVSVGVVPTRTPPGYSSSYGGIRHEGECGLAHQRINPTVVAAWPRSPTRSRRKKNTVGARPIFGRNLRTPQKRTQQQRPRRYPR